MTLNPKCFWPLRPPILLATICILIGIGIGSRADSQKGTSPVKKPGWLYIHSYLTAEQVAKHGGIATPPFFIFDQTGDPLPSGHPDHAHAPGRLIPVPAGIYHVEAGGLNSGATRTTYQVVRGRVTEIQTGFVQVQTWKEEIISKGGCAPWNATMHVFVEQDGGWEPLFSNSLPSHGTRDFGMIQLLVGNYRVLWQGFTADVTIRQGEIYRLPVGISGPLPLPKGRLSKERSESGSARSLVMCSSGPTHVLAGRYWQSSVRTLELFPYEERVWIEVDVPPMDDYGYTVRLTPDPIPHALLRGERAQPVHAPTRSRRDAPSGDKPLQASEGQLPSEAGEGEGGDQVLPRTGVALEGLQINWDAPP